MRHAPKAAKDFSLLGDDNLDARFGTEGTPVGSLRCARATAATSSSGRQGDNANIHLELDGAKWMERSRGASERVVEAADEAAGKAP